MLLRVIDALEGSPRRIQDPGLGSRQDVHGLQGRCGSVYLSDGHLQRPTKLPFPGILTLLAGVLAAGLKKCMMRMNDSKRRPELAFKVRDQHAPRESCTAQDAPVRLYLTIMSQGSNNMAL